MKLRQCVMKHGGGHCGCTRSRRFDVNEFVPVRKEYLDLVMYRACQ